MLRASAATRSLRRHRPRPFPAQVFKSAGAEVVGVSGDKPADNASFASAQRLTFPLLTDEGAAREAALCLLLLHTASNHAALEPAERQRCCTRHCRHRCLQTLRRAACNGAGLHARAVRQALGVKRDLFGLLPGRQTFVFDKAGRNALVFRSQLNAEQHIAEALKVVKTLA